MKRRIILSPELIIGSVLFIILIALAIFVVSLALRPPASLEVCDLLDNDYDGKVDEGYPVTCHTDKECGPTGTFGQARCIDGSVFKDGMRNTCVNEPGSCLSECYSEQIPILVQKCKKGCDNGVCIP